MVTFFVLCCIFEKRANELFMVSDQITTKCRKLIHDVLGRTSLASSYQGQF